MAEPAEVIQFEVQQSLEFFEPSTLRLVEAVPDMAEDEIVRLRTARFIGQCALKNEADLSSESQLNFNPIESLYDALQLAAEDNPDALKMVETNARTDVIERTIKAGHVIKVDLQKDEAGRIQQYGQSVESVQANSLRLAAGNWQMRERTEAEATNAFRIEQLDRQGVLDEYYFVVFSRAADNMTEQQMAEAGFFTKTMSCAIQVTTAENGRITTESAFVAGVKNPGEERHDGETIEKTARRLGVDLSNKNATEILNTPLIIHKSLMPSGVIDLVKLYDESASGTFFGQDQPPQDYQEYLKKCKDREQSLQPKVNEVVKELLANVSNIKNPLEAVKKLHEISEKHMVEQAVRDHSIDPSVFGAVAAVHIEQSRIFYVAGNHEAALRSMDQAKATAVSKSCPSILQESANQSLTDQSLLKESNNLINDPLSETKPDEDQYGSLTFKCQKGHTNKRPRNKLIDKCKTCGVSVRC